MPKTKKAPIEMPIMREMCETCPFREDRDGVDEVRTGVMQRVLTEGSQTCHSTGIANGEPHDSHLCRGARNFQLEVFPELFEVVAAVDDAGVEEGGGAGRLGAREVFHRFPGPVLPGSLAARRTRGRGTVHVVSLARHERRLSRVQGGVNPGPNN